jgi:hypothetical protein
LILVWPSEAESLYHQLDEPEKMKKEKRYPDLKGRKNEGVAI